MCLDLLDIANPSKTLKRDNKFKKKQYDLE